MTTEPLATPRVKLAVGVGAAGLLLIGAYVVLRPFLVPIAWAAVLAYATWPAYRRVLRALGGRDVIAAFLMTLVVFLAVALPITFVLLALADDVAAVFRLVRGWAQDPPALPAWIADLPVVGSTLVGWYDPFRADPGALRELVVQRGAWLSQGLLAVAGDIGRNLGRLGLTLVTIFFLYRHGETVLDQTHRVLDRLAGSEMQRRLAIVGATVRAVGYGVLLTAAIQGLLAGVGFWVAGLPRSALLGSLTALVALTPIGPPTIWLPAGLWLLATSGVWTGIAVLLWGGLVVSSVDNVLRPYLIGGPTQIPFLLLFFGVLGGLATFGLLGLFAGPAILAVGLALWREWAAAPAVTAPGTPGAAS